MYCTSDVLLKARKIHVCTNCGEDILPGCVYHRWMSICDNKALTNKMHPECLESLREEAAGGSFEYTLFEGERPRR